MTINKDSYSINDFELFKTTINNCINEEMSKNSGHLENLPTESIDKISLLFKTNEPLIKASVHSGNIIPNASLAEAIDKVATQIKSDDKTALAIIHLTIDCLKPPAKNILEVLPSDMMKKIMEERTPEEIKIMAEQATVAKKWHTHTTKWEASTIDSLVNNINEKNTSFLELGFDNVDAIITFVEKAQVAKKTIKCLNLSKLSYLPLEKLTRLITSCSTTLEVLDLSHSSLTTLPNEIETCTQLKKLILHGSHSFKTLPDNIEKLTALEILDLSECPLEELPQGIAKLNNLTELNLSVCPITQIPDGISALIELRKLELYWTPLIKIESEQIKLSRLEHLNKNLKIKY